MNYIEYEESYLVYNDGKIYSKKKNRFQKPRQHSNGYLKCTINGKDKYIHRLVAECFLEKQEGFYEVNHKDGVKSNNNVDNLEWTNRSINNKHAFDIGLRTSKEMREISLCDKAVEARKKRRKFNDEQIKEVLSLIGNGSSDTFIARKYNTSRGCIYGIRSNKSYKEYQ